MAISALGAAYTLSFELSPIMFCGGIAKNIPGGILPIIAITEAATFGSGLLGSGGPTNFDNYFAHFAPLPGGTLGENQFGTYPFANQAVAANAAIAQPLTISMLMICPAHTISGYSGALMTMLALKAAMAQHDSSGGTYTIVTPKAFYTDCVRLRMVDVSTAGSKQPQNAYQIDFFQPLLTISAAQQAQSSLMSKLTGGTQITGQPSWSGSSPTVGNPSTLAGPSIIPSASGTQSGAIAPIIPVQSAALPPL